MLEQNFGVKDLIDVAVKAASPFRFGEREVEVGEPLLYFETVQLADLSQSSTMVAARGGRENLIRVTWEKNSDTTFRIMNGVMSSMGFFLLTNSRVVVAPEDDSVFVPYNEVIVLDEKGQAQTEYAPAPQRPIFAYDYKNDTFQGKITPITVEDNVVSCGAAHAHKNVFVSYYFDYGDNALLYVVDRNRFNGLVSIEGKLETKGEIDGVNGTMLVTMPRAKIVSNLALRVGESAQPVVSRFDLVATPKKTAYSDYCLLELAELKGGLRI